MERIANRFLKQWSGICTTANTSLLYRSRSNKGLQLTSITLAFMRSQISKASLIKHSTDPLSRALYDHKLKLDEVKTRVWTPTVELETAEHPQAHFHFGGTPVQGKAGLGLIPIKRPVPGTQAHRHSVAQTIAQLHEDERLVRVYDLAMQGSWTTWDKVISLDTSWQNLIYGLPPKLLSFALNACQNTLPTPDLLRIWGKTKLATCKLCSKPSCTLYHILCNCPFSLHSKRYNWRHDSVLRTIEKFIRTRVTDQNAIAPVSSKLPAIKFVPAGAPCSAKSSASRQHLLTPANDWIYLCDYDKSPIMFPPEITATSLRPDNIIWSSSSRTAIIIELTVPSEDAIADAAFRKSNKYASLVADCRLQGWTIHFMSIEVGSRGFVAASVSSCFRKLGLTNPVIKAATSTISRTALRCSYALYLARNNPSWKPLDLLTEIVAPQKFGTHT